MRRIYYNVLHIKGGWFNIRTFLKFYFIAGVLHSEPEALQLAQAIAKTEGVELTGVYAHCGNSYQCKGVEKIQAVAQETTTLTLQFMEK